MKRFPQKPFGLRWGIAVYDIKPRRITEGFIGGKPPRRQTARRAPITLANPFEWLRIRPERSRWATLAQRLLRMTAGLVIVVYAAGNFAYAPASVSTRRISVGEDREALRKGLGGRGVAAAEEPAQAELEEKLRDIEAEIAAHEKNVLETQEQGKTLKGEVSRLDSRIKKLNLQIKAAELDIKRLSRRIGDTAKAIEGSQLKISRAKTLLERSMQAVYESDRVSLLEMLLANAAISSFFAEVSAQNAIQARAKIQLDELKSLKDILGSQKAVLVDEKEDQVALLLVQENQKKDLSGERKQKDTLLALTKGKESLYQQLLKQSQKTAAEIRSQLYRLLGGGEIKFEDALRYAEFAASHTGIRSALLLGVMDKESDFGANVGRCSWKTAMHPTRDQPAFLQITQELGLSAEMMLVSCPILRDGSYGGAMGIAQFLPSTWLIYKNRIAEIAGRIPSPWNPQDAFVATALYLADLGATSQTYEAERRAAAKYYAGKRWQRYLRSYGDRVMRLAQHWQEQIDILKRTASR